MAFATYETSLETGLPIEVYKLTVGNITYRFTSVADEQVLGADTYEPIAVERSQITMSQDERTEILNMTMPSNHPFIRRYTNIVPGLKANLSIFRFHRLDGALEQILFYKGLVRSVAFTRNATEAKIAVMPLTKGLSRMVPRFTYQSPCNHILYDERCKVGETLANVHTNIVTGVVGTTITINGLTAKGTGWADGGMLTNPARDDYRLILSHTGDDVVILMPFTDAFGLLGETLEVLAGCDHSLPTCKTKFDNVINYGGFKFVPTRNPFTVGI